MHRHWLLQVFRLEGCFPNLVHHLLVIHFLEDSVAAYDDEVIIFLNLKRPYFWYCNHNVRITSVSLILCLDITDCARHRKSTWEDSVRTN